MCTHTHVPLPDSIKPPFLYMPYASVAVLVVE
jgi:hypothetical protein